MTNASSGKSAGGGGDQESPNPEHVRLLWEVCQVPDFRKTIGGDHARLLGHIFKHLSSGKVLPADWIADEVARLNQTDGGIDTLVSRIAGIRVWTYISHRSGWLKDAIHCGAPARSRILSDALHNSLTSDVDQRTASLVQRLRDKENLRAAVSAEGEVLVEGHYVGKLNGFRFVADSAEGEVASRAVTNAAFQALGREVERRAQTLIADEDTEFSLTDQAHLVWRGAFIARLVRGGGALSPGIRLVRRATRTAPCKLWKIDLAVGLRAKLKQLAR